MNLPASDLALYRPAVGIMLLSRERKIFVGRRIDMPAGLAAWQMPQGGIDPGETPREAALRELKEETGTAKAGDKTAKAPDKKDDKSDAAAEPGAIDPAIMGTADDYQLARAVDMIRGITLFNGRVVN